MNLFVSISDTKSECPTESFVHQGMVPYSTFQRRELGTTEVELEAFLGMMLPNLLI